MFENCLTKYYLFIMYIQFKWQRLVTPTKLLNLHLLYFSYKESVWVSKLRHVKYNYTNKFFVLNILQKYPNKISKIVYCSRTVPEIEKCIEEMRRLYEYYEQEDGKPPKLLVLALSSRFITYLI